MHIHDFHTKFVSMSEDCNLFQALRNLSLVEDVKSLLADGVGMEWVPWPPMQAEAGAMPAEA